VGLDRIGTEGDKHVLRQVERDGSDLRHDRRSVWNLADPAWHSDAARGRSHHQHPLP
jgi:hypothetical protein